MDLEEEQEYEQQMEEEDEEEEITQEDAWAVISAYFEEKGLVRQQLDSFDEFIQNTMQEIVDESADIEIRPESQHNPGHQSDFAEVPVHIFRIYHPTPHLIVCSSMVLMMIIWGVFCFVDYIQNQLRSDLLE